jgi:parallel beta-helix repeat protein
VHYDYRGWVVFDLSDLTFWNNVSIIDVKLLINNYQMINFDTINFTLLNTTPFNNPPLNTSKTIFNESGPGGIQIGQYTFTSTSDYTYHSFKTNLNSLAVSAINNKLKNESKYYSFPIGMRVSKLQGTYFFGYAHWTDIRLVVTFTCNDTILNTSQNQGIALGDDQTGYIYPSSATYATNYEIGYTYTYSGYDYRSYMHWEMQKIKNLLLNNNQTQIYFTKLSLRFNHFNSEFSKISFYQMVNNVTNSSALDIFKDCNNGTRYLNQISIPESKTTELEYDLGFNAVRDFQKAFNNNDSEAFFAVGLTGESTTYSFSYDYGPKLVLEWADDLPVYNINQDEYYPTIQMGVLEANSNDTLLVKNGTYFENPIIEKPVKIIGENKANTVISGSGNGDIIYISAENVSISGFTIKGIGSESGYNGIKIEGAKNCTIVDNIFLHHSIGTLLENSVEIIIENNSMSQCGILIKGEQLEYWTTHTISNNNIVNGKPIIYRKDLDSGMIPLGAGQIIIANCSNITIQNQVLNQCTLGLTLAYSDYNQILNITSNLNYYYGINLKSSSYNEILNCNCESNYDGIVILNSTGNVIKNNQCNFNNKSGIHLITSSNNLVFENYCQKNNNGILLEHGTNNSVVDNTCLFNLNSGIQNIVKPGFDAEKTPIDVVLTLDTSGSMGTDQRLVDLKTATTNFIKHEFLNEQDRVAIFDFTSSGNNSPLQPFINCNESGKMKLISIIENFTASGSTPLWDKAGYAINYSINNGSSREAIVIVMTDGGDTSSYDYCPGPGKETVS